MNIIADENRYCGDEGWKPNDLPLFGAVAVSPKQWLGSAAEHLYAAEVLLPTVREQRKTLKEAMEKRKSISMPPLLTSVYLFHCALSVENSIKSLISCAHQNEIIASVEATSKIPKILLGHDLKELAHRAELPLSIDQEFVLVFLTRYGVWSGKYHQPTRFSEFGLTEMLSDGNHYMTSGYNPEVIPSYFKFSLNFYNKIREKVNKQMQPTQKTRG